MHPKYLQIKDFTYQLPDERIARYPLAERDLSKLLIYDKGNIKEDVYRHIAQYLPEKAALFFNNSKVIPARIFFTNKHGAKIEIFCLEPDSGMDMAVAMGSTGSCSWQCLVGRAGKWKEKLLHITGADFSLSAEIVGRNKDAFIISFNWQPAALSFAGILDKTGMMPIPPYLKRESERMDFERYQTIYAQHRGSVAAPTAGLHFTEGVLSSLKSKHIDMEYLTLHVGAGTFKPVKTPAIGEHEMHAEVMDITAATITRLLQKKLEALQSPAPIVAVGTTALRLLESLYWMGLKTLQNPDVSLEEMEVKQWQPYETDKKGMEVSVAAALQSLRDWMKRNKLDRILCKTQIMIAPGYQLQVADALITNFHQPNSTLLLLVAALVGNDWKKIYDYALQHHFRFLSYGDGSLLFPQVKPAGGKKD